MTAVTLTPEELIAITRRERTSAQARVLHALGIPFREHPSDAVLLVSRAAAEAALGATIEKARAHGSQQPTLYEVDVEGIRKHGKTANSY